MALPSHNYLRAALLMPANFFALAAGGAASWWLHDLAPVIAASSGALLYSLVLSWLPSFRRGVRSGNESNETLSVSEEVQLALNEWAPSQREHYAALAELRDRILANYRKLPGGRVMVASSERRLEMLLLSFVRLLSTLNAYRKFLSATDRQALEAELKDLEADLGTEKNERLREVKWRRVEILRKRVGRFAQAEESREVLSHQLAAIEDVFGLLHEQSISIRDAEQVTAQLESLSAEVEVTEATVRDLEKLVAFNDELGAMAPQRVRG